MFNLRKCPSLFVIIFPRRFFKTLPIAYRCHIHCYVFLLVFLKPILHYGFLYVLSFCLLEGVGGEGGGGGGVTLSEIMQACSFEQEITLSLISGVYIQVMNRR